MIRRLAFAAPLVYSPHGVSVTAERSRVLRARIKRGEERVFQQIAAYLVRQLAAGEFRDYLGPAVLAVPVPGHSPTAPGAVLATARIAAALQSEGLVGDVQPLLERTVVVAKSATAAPADRPRAAQHYASLRVVAQLTPVLPQILLIDDFVTRGATLLGGASRLVEAYPSARIRAFALVRSITDRDIDSMREACDGWIELRDDGECWRRP